MTTLEATKRFNINLIKPFTTYFTAIAVSKERVIEMLREELESDSDYGYSVEDFEIEEIGPAKDQLGYYLEEKFKNEMN